jgi:hypothetical protein
MPDLATGSIRTVVTLAIGACLTAGAEWIRQRTGIALPSDPMSVNVAAGAVYALVTAIWYLVFASLERRWPIFGVFLGWPKAPRYNVEDSAAEESPQELPAPRSPRGGTRSTRGADPLP